MSHQSLNMGETSSPLNDMSHQSLDLGEISSSLHDDREDHRSTESPHARVEPPLATIDDSAQLRGQAPYSPLFFEDGPDPSSILVDYDDEDSDTGSPIRTTAAPNGANQGSRENIRAADEFLMSLGEAEDFRAASAAVTRDMSVKINATSRDELRRECST